MKFIPVCTAITQTLLEKSNLTYSRLYTDIKNRLQICLSHRDFSECIKGMIKESLLDRKDPGNVRGTRVYYSLTRKAIEKDQLGILGIDEKTQKRKSLYQLLLFFEMFKRRNLISERQLCYLLKKVGSSHNELKIIGKGNNPYSFNLYTAFQPINGMEIIRLDQHDNITNPQMPAQYYTVLPGFSVKEFTEYLRLLRGGKDPQPFSKYSSIPQIPSLFLHYTEREVEEAIGFLRDDGIIKPIQGVFPGELRFDIVDNSLKHLIIGVWMVHIIDFHSLIARLGIKKPTDVDKKYLKIFLGDKATDRCLTYAHGFRRKGISIKYEMNQAVKEWEADRTLLIQKIKKKHEKLIQKNEVIAEIIEEVCSSPVFHLTATNRS